MFNSATGRIFLAYLPQQTIRPRLRIELDRAISGEISWPDLDPNAESVEKLISKIRREHVSYVDGRYIPG
jgi:DNA-binding IclR family transcriptional regulator